MSSGRRWLRSPKSDMSSDMDSQTTLPETESFSCSFPFLIGSGTAPYSAITQTPNRTLFTILGLFVGL